MEPSTYPEEFYLRSPILPPMPNSWGDSKQKNKKITAFYGNLNYSMNKIGFSLEWKNYQNFLIASGINEPPALVREHSYLVLNRSTNVLLPDNESGVQFEFF